jgi:hypothetical protein
MAPASLVFSFSKDVMSIRSPFMYCELCGFSHVGFQQPFPDRPHGYLQPVLVTPFVLIVRQYGAGSQPKRTACIHKTGHLSFFIPGGELPADLYRMRGLAALFDNKVAFVPVLEIVSFRSAPEQFNGNDILNDSPAIFRKSTSQGGEIGRF